MRCRDERIYFNAWPGTRHEENYYCLTKISIKTYGNTRKDNIPTFPFRTRTFAANSKRDGMLRNRVHNSPTGQTKNQRSNFPIFAAQSKRIFHVILLWAFRIKRWATNCHTPWVCSDSWRLNILYLQIRLYC